MLLIYRWRQILSVVNVLSMKCYILECHQDIWSRNLGLSTLVTLSSKIHLVENILQFGPHSTAIFHWWLQNLFLVLPQVLDQYGGILISDLGKRRFYNCITLLVSLLHWKGGKMRVQCSPYIVLMDLCSNW